jgi:hypothetical protein
MLLLTIFTGMDAASSLAINVLDDAQRRITTHKILADGVESAIMILNEGSCFFLSKSLAITRLATLTPVL